MAAEIFDELEAQQEADAPEEQTTEELVESFAEPTEEQQPDEDIPEKYRGKTAREIAQMHQEAEKLLGKHSSEVGELRTIVDSFIKGQTSVNVQQQQQQVEEEPDFFEDPERAVSRAIEKNPHVQQAAQTAEQFRKQNALATLRNAHPDMEEVFADPKFMEWVKGSTVREQMLAFGNQNYQPEVVAELLTNYKDLRSVATSAVEVEQQSRKQQVKAASTGSASGSSNAGAGKRIYLRRDIIKLMKNDPDRYEAMSDDIMRAYAENRVR